MERYTRKREIARIHVHLTLPPLIHHLAKIKAVKNHTDLSHAVEKLLGRWVKGKMRLG